MLRCKRAERPRCDVEGQNGTFIIQLHQETRLSAFSRRQHEHEAYRSTLVLEDVDMDGGLTITFISVAMFVGCFLLGFIPLLFRLSEKGLQFVSILGAGLLCGTALAIIIPEGVGLLEESWRASSSSSAETSSLNVSEKNAASTEGGPPPRFFIGVALTFGFILMFVVDQIGKYCSMHDQMTRLPNSVGITATLGLVIHAAADGFALGAAVATGQVTVQVIVFLAVILHKAPAAFGLVTFLMLAGLEKKFIQGHLLAFSAAAPIVAIITYFILHASGSSSQSQLSATGVGMLFSAGTFLYVATVHVLPEISSSRAGRLPSDLQQHTGAEAYPSDLHQYTGDEVNQQQHYLGLLESLTLILGIGLPVVLALGLTDD
ncbi:zinc transporter ZIP9 isoform X1 [Thunnus maccoyii]|uniref:zinc transporter ZIP9 isoform X1 n=1 Tax=Thunnus maccoyii TaxID=8240 RepID=UPI001C4B6EB4|nr:zinc transporter ZIP9 isoform X1 [Thunnus maccoyii]